MKRKYIILLIVLLFLSKNSYAWFGSSGTTIISDGNSASTVTTDTTNFGTNLSIADTTVQQALDTLDDVIGGGGTGLPVVVSANTVLISNSTTWVAVGMNGDATLDSDGLLTIDESVAHSWTGIQDFVDVNITGAITVDSNTVNLSDTTDEYVLAFDTGTQTWRGVEAAAGTGDVTSVGDCLTGACDNIEFTTLSTTGDMTVGGSLTISDGGTPAIIGATNTAGMLWIADGIDYGEVAVSGNVTIDSTGDTTVNLDGVTQTKSATIFNPNAAYDIDTEVLLWNDVDADLTITGVYVANNGTIDITGDLKWTDSFVTAVVGTDTTINALDTTSGVLADTSISSGTVAAGKDIYMTWDAQPAATVTQVGITIKYSYD